MHPEPTRRIVDRLPNTFLIGTPKAGTTALYSMLRKNPAVQAPRQKEPRYFTEQATIVAGGIPITGPPRQIRYTRNHAWIMKQFRLAPGQPVRLDGSTFYFASDDAATKIAAAIAAPRFVIGLRDPVDRAFSHYCYEQKIGLKAPPFTQTTVGPGGPLEFYSHTSDYVRHLRGWLRQFEAAQFFVFDFRLLKTHPEVVLRRLCCFLEIPYDPVMLSDNRNYNPSGAPRSRRIQTMLYQSAYLAPFNGLPAWLRRPLGNARRRLLRWNTKTGRNPEISGQVKEFLARQLAESTKLYMQIAAGGAGPLDQVLSGKELEKLAVSA